MSGYRISDDQREALRRFGELWAGYDGKWQYSTDEPKWNEAAAAALKVAGAIVREAWTSGPLGKPDDMASNPELQLTDYGRGEKRPVRRESVFWVRCRTPVREDEIGMSAHNSKKGQDFRLELGLGARPHHEQGASAWQQHGRLAWSLVLPERGLRREYRDVGTFAQVLNERLGLAGDRRGAFTNLNVIGDHRVGVPFLEFGPDALSSDPEGWASSLYDAVVEATGFIRELLDSQEDILVKALKEVGMGKANEGPEVARSTGSEGKTVAKKLAESIKGLLEGLMPQVVLYGPPGTGKTYVAKEVAAKILDVADTKALADNPNFALVVFHPAYEYDQFIGGLGVSAQDGKPRYEFTPGRLLELVENVHEGPKVLIIDEFNRGNLPKLLGELLYALEYRKEKVKLSCRSDGLTLPKDLYIIATMNTADRSIAMIDAAIRRRFAFYKVEPDREVVEKVWADSARGTALANLMERLNVSLPQDGELGDLGVGHSYFLPKDPEGKDAWRQVELKWRYQVRPLLDEYAQTTPLGKAEAYRKAADLDAALEVAREPLVP